MAFFLDVKLCLFLQNIPLIETIIAQELEFTGKTLQAMGIVALCQSMKPWIQKSSQMTLLMDDLR
ncbi:hypothetical protein BW247_16045 [Acidihalobacter ferrooxydans]|uniref:Uncharacterized protein n=1 Tax=Acidihalobacter ferrooxydans TaxID=1765967 RepID=A0A1P8UKP5_9GAMM|nr:hypothetical protein BW247_16045 [Acidihalobacter ferrooxydans]